MAVLHLPNEAELEAIEGWLLVEEGRRLAFLAAIVPPELAIVELGSWKGKSSAWLATGSRSGRGAKVYAVDTFAGSPETPLEPGQSTLPAYELNLTRLGLRDLVTPIVSTSAAAAKSWRLPIGLLFIDALHAYDSVLEDYTLWHPFIPPGGWIAFHDYSSWEGPTRVVEEVLKPSGLWTDFMVHGVTFTAKKI